MRLEKKARVLITQDCNRNCYGCCNTYSQIMKHTKHITNLDELSTSYGEIILTGGEPMLYPHKTEKIVERIKNWNPSPRVYLYSALYDNALESIIPKIDGLHYTIHESATEEDLSLFYELQELLQTYRKDWNEKSFRLFIDNKANLAVRITPNVWDQVNISKWLTEKELLDKQPGGLPKGETLFIYDGN